MGGVYTIYAYFNSEQIQGILNAVVMLVGSGGVDGDYLSIVRVAGMLGLFISVGYGFVRARGEDAGQYVIMMAIFYSTLFVPRVTVTIEEHGGTGGGAPIVVDNVPLGLAFFASTTSHIGYWLTEKTETFFSLPDTSLKLSQNGLMGGARALREVQSAAMPDPVLAQDMINFMRDCINPELVLSPASVASLLTSTNIWDSMAPANLDLVNPGRMVTLAGSLGAIQCDDAYNNVIGPRLAPAATSEFARIAQMLSPSATPASANTILTSLLPAAEGLIMTASATTADALKQRMMINMLNDTSANMAQLMNDPSAAQAALASAMATSNANSSYSVMAKLARETLPLVRNSIELIVIGVFPIVLLLIIIAGSKGGQVLRSYVMTMLWVQLWAPLYAIVNYVGTMAGSKSMKAALAGVDGIAVVNAAQLINTTISTEAIAGMLTISVPMIALALVKGGEVAMAGVTSGLTGPADRAAAKVGEQVGAGNVAMGNTSWGNYSANNSNSNKSNNAFGYTSPNRGDVGTEFGSMTYRGSQAGTPNAVGNLSPEFGNVGVTGSHGSRVESTNVGSSGEQSALTRGTSTGLSQRTSGQFTQQEGAAASAKLQKTMESSVGGDYSWLTREGAGNSSASTDRAGTSAGTGHSSNIDLGGRAGFKAGADVIAQAPTSTSQQTGSAVAAAASTAAGAGIVTPPGATAPNGTAGDLQSKAARAAQQLGQAPSRSSYGPTASYGFGVRDGETQSWTGETANSTEQQQRAEKNFDKAAKAINGLMAKTSNAGERAAMQSFLGSLAKSTDATYQTSVGQTYSQTASDTNSHTNASGASVQVNDNARYGAAALALSGGSGAKALENAVTNPGFLSDVAGRVAPGVAASVASHSGPATGMDGTAIDAPIPVSQQRKDGESAVEQQRGMDSSAAAAAGHGYIQSANSHRASMGAPASTAMPDQAPAQNAYDKNKGASERGYVNTQDRQATSGGITRVTEHAFGDKGGVGRLLDVSLFGGFLGQSKTPDELRQPLQQLAEADPQTQSRLASIGKTGRVTADDVDFLAERGRVMNIKQ